VNYLCYGPINLTGSVFLYLFLRQLLKLSDEAILMDGALGDVLRMPIKQLLLRVVVFLG
jgi:hypothetical protein